MPYMYGYIVFAIVALAYKSYATAVVAIALFVIFSAYSLFVSKKTKGEIENYISKLTANSNDSAKETLIHFPLPVVVLQANGRISWYNDRFYALTKSVEEIYDTPISLITQDINMEEILKNPEEIALEAKCAGSTFKVFGNLMKPWDKDKNDFLLVLFWQDITDYTLLKSRYDSEESVEAIILIDNYEELLQNTPENQRGQLLTEIEREISDFAATAGGLLKHFERDRYLLVFQKQYLTYMIKSKFEILEKVKAINEGNKIPATLSIGIGKDGGGYAENDAFAKASIDMALGRGGDQAVIKDESGFAFYGGLSREVERHTRVKARVVAHALRELIANSSQVLIMGHAEPDLDSIGSAIGLYKAVKKCGKTAQIVVEAKNAASKELIKRFKEANNQDDAFVSKAEAMELVSKNTLLIIVDAHRKVLMEEPRLLSETSQIVLIDHHRRSSDFIDNAVLLYHEVYASSTCELVVDLLPYLCGDNVLSPTDAEALYAGMVMDTKNFTFKTGVRTFEAASYLRKCGVDTISVKKLFRSDMDNFAKRALIVQSAEIYSGNIAISLYNGEKTDIGTVVAQAADELMNISGVEASFVICADKNMAHISGRSLGKINVQVILEALGGGGHLTVAGAQLQDITIEEAEEKLKEAIDNYKQQ